MLYYATGNKLSKLAIGADGQTLSVVGGVPTWSDTTSGVAHKLLSDSHSDTTAATVLRGDLITGQGASASWSRLAIGASGQFLYSDGVDTNWHTLTKGDVNLGNVENITLSTWTGSTNLTTLGTITTGVWNGSAVDVARGGTGANTFASNYLLKGNGASALSSSILYDNGTNVGIGTVTPDSFKVEVAGDIGPESDNTRNLGSPARYFNTAYIKNLVTGASGAVGYWNRTGNVLSPITNGDTVSIFAGASNASGTIFNVSYTGSTVTLDGSLIGAKIDLNDGHVIPTNQSVTGVRVVLPTTTNTNLVGTTVTMDGMSLGYGVGTGINQTGAGTTIYSGAQLLMPALTQTAGTLIANGALITTPSSITTGGTANGISISATGVGAGILNGISVSSITGSTGTETALRIGSGWDSVLSVNGNQVVSGAGVVLVSAGGTGITSYTVGDIIYADSANSFTKLPGGAGNNGKALVISGGVPTWGVVSGSTCSDCVLNDPTAVTTQTITPNNEDISSLVVRQTTHSSPTHDIFSVTNATGSTRYFYVDQNGNVSTGGVASQSITLTPTSDTPALTLVGTNVATANLAYLNAKNTQGTIFNLAYGTSTTLADALIGAKIDLATNLTASDQSVTGISLVLPSVTNTTSTSTYRGLAIGLSGGAGVNQNGAGVTVFSGIDVTIPPLTQTAGTLTGNGILITTPSSITTGGTANGINISATGVGAGTLRGVNVGNITAGAGAETAIRTGTGWDYAAIFEAGNVGIGTTTPGAKLHIEDGVLLIKPISGDSTGIRIRERDDGNDAVKISGGASSGIVDIMDGGVATIKLLGSGNSYFNNGNIGIGTTTPGAKLEVYGSSVAATGFIYANDGTNYAALDPTYGVILNRANAYVNNRNIGGDLNLRVSNLAALDKIGLTIQSDGDVQIMNGNVGIGTTSPSVKLEVVSSGQVFNSVQDVGSGQSIFTLSRINHTTQNNVWNESITNTTGTNGSLIIYPTGATADIGFSGNTSWLNQQLVIKGATGNVGIGTTSPMGKLHLYKNNADTVLGEFIIEQNGTGDSSIQYSITGLSNWITGIDNSDSDKFKISKSNALGTSDMLTIDSSGNVGIGTTSPISTISGLDISSGGRSIVIGAENGLSTRTDNVGKYGRILGAHYTNAEQPIVGLLLGSYSGTNQVSIGGGTSLGSAATFISFYTASNTITPTGTERMRIDSSGNVGIGTTTPAQKLHIASGNVLLENNQYLIGEKVGGDDVNLIGIDASSNTLVQAGAGNNLIFKEGGDEWMRITSSGNIGIGTTTPGYKFDVSGDARLTGDLYVNGSDVLLSQNGGGYSTIGLQGTASGLYVGVNLKNDGVKQSDAVVAWRSLYINTSDVYSIQRSAAGTSAWTTPFIINSTGNVGIGTTSPGVRLEVIGKDSNGNQAFASDSGILLRSASSGNYGIIAFGTDDTNNYNWLRSSDEAGLSRDLRFYGTSTGALVTIQSAGNVGIGTTSPAAILDLYGATAVKPRITWTINTSWGGLDLYEGATQVGYIQGIGSNFATADRRGDVEILSASNDISLWPGAAQTVTFKSGGNVGIGTTSPTQKLSIVESSSLYAGLDLKGGQTGDASWLLASGYPSAGDFSIRETAVQTSLTIKKTTGNIGIGTTTPGAKLDVQGNIFLGTSSSSNPYLYFQNDGNDMQIASPGARLNFGDGAGNIFMSVTDEGTIGNVGIGTTAPGARLQINASSENQDILRLLDHNGALSANFRNSGSAGLLELADGGVRTILFDADGNSYFNSGNVGVGTTTPTAKMHIEDSAAELLYAKKTLDTFNSVQHVVAPATWTNDTTIVKPGYYTVTGDVLNVVGDFLYIGKDTTFTDIYFDFDTILSAGTNRRWEYNVPEYETAVVTGSVSATTLTVTAVTSGTLFMGDTITDGATLNATITGFGTGTGGVGTYTISPTSGTLASRTITARGTWKTLTIATDGTAQWQNDGVVNFSTPGDWTTATVNSVTGLYWIRVGTMSGTFTVEPTLRLCLPASSAPTSVAEIHSGDTGVPDFIVDNKGNIALGYTNASNYKLRVAGTGYFSGALTTGGTLSAGAGAFSGAITNTISTTGFTHVGGLILNGPAATALIPNQNSPISRFSSQAWNGSATRVNAMDIYLNPDSEPVTSARMAFKNTTIDGLADASELMNLDSNGRLNVLGRAQATEDMFDRVFHYVGGVYTDVTLIVSSFGSATGDVLDVVGNYVYVGKENQFSEMYFDFGTIMSSGTNRTFEYWDGDSWETLTVTDGTAQWQNDGSVTFTPPGAWAKGTVNTVTDLYWVRIGTASGTFTVEPTLRVLLPNTNAITKEVLSNNEFDDSSKWTATGDWAYSTSDYTFTYASGAGTIRQAEADFNSPLEPNTWYRFRYVVGVAAPSTTLCWIGEEVATGKTYFSGSTTEVDVFFKTNADPGDFVIYTTATATSGFRLDSMFLKKTENGRIYASGDIRSDGVFRGNGTEGIKVDSLGNVGIGTTTPGARLEVKGIVASDILKLTNSAGNVAFQIDNSTLNAKFHGSSLDIGISGTNDTNTGIGWDGSDILALYTGGTKSVVINNGNVGIGTTSPGAKLHILAASGDASPHILVERVDANDATLGFKNTEDQWAIGMDRSNGNSFTIADNNDLGANQRMVITSSGNVGIGSTSPGAKLEISSANFDHLRLTRTGASTRYIDARVGVEGYLVFDLQTASQYTEIRDVGSAKFRFHNNGNSFLNGGNVGVGTTSPGAKLDVSVGSTDAVTGLLINQNDLDKIGLQIANATSATATMFDFASNSSAGDVFNLDWDSATTMSDALTGIDLDFTNFSADGVSALYGLRINDPASATGSTEYGILLQGTNWDKALYSQDDIGLADSANLFLGTGNDLQLYHNGTDSYITNNTGKLYLGSAATSDLLLQANGGKVGIGTTSPDTTLKVVGSICASATDTACFGTTAGNIYAANFIVDGTTHLPDYVFEADYPLQSIEELKNYLLENKHLPGVPSASEVIQTGLNLSQMVPAILEKTEENTLYIISQNDQITSITQNQNKIVEQLTGQLADQNLSVDNKLQLIGQTLNGISADAKDLESLQTQVEKQNQDLIELQKQMADIELQNKAFNEFLLAFDVKSIDNFAKLNAPVNVFLGKIIASDIEALGIIKATDIEATNMLKGQNLELGSQVSGTNLIKAGELESAKILTSEANAGIKLYITPKGSTQGKTLYYDESDIEIGVGFKVRIDAPALEKDVEFNWLIVK